MYFVVINDVYLFELNWYDSQEPELVLDEDTGDEYCHIDSWTNFPLSYGEFLQFCIDMVSGITFEEINSVKAEIIYNTKYL